MRLAWLAALAACSVPATKFTPIGDGGMVAGDGKILTSAMLSATPTGDVGLGTVVVGQTSGATTITVSNDGDLDSGSIAVTFDDTTLGFTASNDTCTGSALPGHHTCTFDVTFAPTSNASAQTDLHIAATPGGDVMKLVTGSGLLQGQVNITDMPFTYPNTGLAAMPPTKVFTVANNGQSQIGMPVPSITGSGGFTVQSTTCNAPLNQTDTCTVTVAFGPTVVGGQSGSLVVTSTPGGQDAVTIMGTGFAHVAVTSMGGGGGTVSSNTQPGIQCPGTCAADFTSTPVTLTATPNGTSSFAGWGSDCTGTGQCTLDLTANKSVTASFSVNAYPLTVSISNSHQGPTTITSSPPGINCDGVNGCSASFPFGSAVALTANPDPSSAFTVWNSGPCQGSAQPTCTFMMPGQATSAQAGFDFFGTLTIEMNQGDGGTNTITAQVVATTGATISCSNTTQLLGTCTAHISRGVPVTLTYSGNPSWTTCRGGTLMKFVLTRGIGDCAPPTGNICNATSCMATEQCSFTPSTPGNYTSEYDVACETNQ